MSNLSSSCNLWEKCEVQNYFRNARTVNHGRGAYKIMQKSSVQNNKKNRFQHNINTTYLSKCNKNKHYKSISISLSPSSSSFIIVSKGAASIISFDKLHEIIKKHPLWIRIRPHGGLFEFTVGVFRVIREWGLIRSFTVSNYFPN